MKKFVYMILLLLGVTILYVPKANANKIKSFIGAELGILKPGIGSVWNNVMNNDVYFNGKIIAGLKKEYIGAELFYQFTPEKKQGGIDGIDKPFTGKTKFSALGFDVNGYYQLNNSELEVFGGLGIAKYKIELNFTDVEGNENFKDDKIAPRLTVGIQQSLNDNIAISAAFRYAFINLKDSESYKVVKSINEINLGLRYTF
jgi:opacity protein-like surface antigen